MSTRDFFLTFFRLMKSFRVLEDEAYAEAKKSIPLIQRKENDYSPANYEKIIKVIVQTKEYVYSQKI